MGMAGSGKGHSVNFKSKHYKGKESSEEFKVKEKAAHFSLCAPLLSFTLFTLEGETNDIDLGAPIPPGGVHSCGGRSLRASAPCSRLC